MDLKGLCAPQAVGSEMAFLVAAAIVGLAGIGVAATLWYLPLAWWAANRDAIQVVVLAFAAVVALITLAVAAANTRIRARDRQADRELKLDAQFERAISLLGHGDRTVRLGAIYALERMAERAPDHRGLVVETLTAYLRERSERKREGGLVRDGEGSRPRAASGERQDDERAPVDLQAIFTIIGRRTMAHESRDRTVNLDGAYLVEACPDPAPDRRFRGASLMAADLRGVDLEGADLAGASLIGANLREATLEGAGLRKVKLHEANLAAAELMRADLSEAVLEGASLIAADLEGARLKGADLEGAVLQTANIVGADFSSARNLTQSQLDSAIGDRTTKIPAVGAGGATLVRPDHWPK